MKLITKPIMQAIEKAPLGTHDGKDAHEVPVIAKFFTPDANWTAFATEAEVRDDGDILFFGLVQHHEVELGYFLLSELKQVRGPMGLSIERDRHLCETTLAKAYNYCGQPAPVAA